MSDPIEEALRHGGTGVMHHPPDRRCVEALEALAVLRGERDELESKLRYYNKNLTEDEYFDCLHAAEAEAAVLRGRVEQAESEAADDHRLLGAAIKDAANLQAEVVSLKEALRLIDSPYPESIFRPLISPELAALHAAMRRTGVSNPTERLYAQHARERGEAVRAALASSEEGDEA